MEVNPNWVPEKSWAPEKRRNAVRAWKPEKRRRPRRPRRRGPGSGIWKAALLFLLIAAVATGAGFLIFRGIQDLRPEAGSGAVGICMEGNEMSISWPRAEHMDVCRLYLYEEEKEDYVLEGEYDGHAVLSGIEPGVELRLRLEARRQVELFGRTYELAGYQRDITVTPVEIDRPVLIKKPDTENRRMIISWQRSPNAVYEVYRVDESGEPQKIAETQENSTELRFDGEEGLPEREKPVRIAVRTRVLEEDCILYSALSAVAAVERRDLLDDSVALSWEENGDDRYVLRWEESSADRYELQQWSDKDGLWVSCRSYSWKDELSYDTGLLPSCTQVRFRVVGYDTDAQRERAEYLAVSEEAVFRTQPRALYCTIWPIMALDFWEDAQGAVKAGSIPQGTALCVLGEENDKFRVRYEGSYGYVDSRFCMINLPEYLGNLCEYDIANSFSSIFRIHEYDIPEITDGVVKGYEKICLGDDDFLVPYLYPCTRKLYEAALRVREDGYCLRIYDAFRPNESTRYLYDTVEALLDEQVPGSEEEAQEWADKGLTETCRTVLEELRPEVCMALRELREEALPAITALPAEFLTWTGYLALMGVDPAAAVEEGAEPIAAPGAEGVIGAWQFVQSTTGQELLTPEQAAAYMVLTPEEQELLRGFTIEEIGTLKALSLEELSVSRLYLSESMITYREVMTDNRYRLGSFLAAVTSAHNRGIALDLTLAKLETDEELEMQSAMHDLSWHSALAQNNENANLLAKYMKGAGFNDLSSEWWHFQDDETRSAIGLNTYLDKGVSVEGWKKDDRGWKYRLADGGYYRNTTAAVEGKNCTFDEAGYVTDGMEEAE